MAVLNSATSCGDRLSFMLAVRNFWLDHRKQGVGGNSGNVILRAFTSICHPFCTTHLSSRPCPLPRAARFPSTSPSLLIRGIFPPPFRTPAWVRARRSARQVGDWGQAGRGLLCRDERLQEPTIDPAQETTVTAGPPLPAGVSWPCSCLRGWLQRPTPPTPPAPPCPARGTGPAASMTNVLWPQRLAQPLSPEPPEAPSLPFEFCVGVQPIPSPLLPPTWHLLCPDQKV